MGFFHVTASSTCTATTIVKPRRLERRARRGPTGSGQPAGIPTRTRFSPPPPTTVPSSLPSLTPVPSVRPRTAQRTRTPIPLPLASRRHSEQKLPPARLPLPRRRPLSSPFPPGARILHSPLPRPPPIPAPDSFFTPTSARFLHRVVPRPPRKFGARFFVATCCCGLVAGDYSRPGAAGQGSFHRRLFSSAGGARLHCALCWPSWCCWTGAQRRSTRALIDFLVLRALRSRRS